MKIYLVDGTYELFRNHFGAPRRLAPDGREVGATLGLLRSLLTPYCTVYPQTSPAHLAVSSLGSLVLTQSPPAISADRRRESCSILSRIAGPDAFRAEKERDYQVALHEEERQITDGEYDLAMLQCVGVIAAIRKPRVCLAIADSKKLLLK
jgi:hypothetical protein